MNLDNGSFLFQLQEERRNSVLKMTYSTTPTDFIQSIHSHRPIGTFAFGVQYTVQNHFSGRGSTSSEVSPVSPLNIKMPLLCQSFDSWCFFFKLLASRDKNRTVNTQQRFGSTMFHHSCRASFRYSLRTAAHCSWTDWHAQWSTFTWPAIELGVFIFEPHKDCLSAQQEVESVALSLPCFPSFSSIKSQYQKLRQQRFSITFRHLVTRLWCWP